MAGTFGGAIKLSGESEYQKALKNITQNLTVLSSSMKVLTSSYDVNNESVSTLSAKNEILSEKLKAQSKAVEEAERMLNEAKESTDSNATTINKWQNELNKAQAEVNKTTKEISDNEETMNALKSANVETTNELKEFEKAENDAGTGALKLGDLIKGNLISEAISSGFKKMVSLAKELGTALIDIGKQSLTSYADYEQLVGGVDTLFKDSSKTIQQYANNAYKTAGLSANQYMETVTSFSASLIQSLDGDTKAAAEAANLAITDMSDNANKMGTDMSMIQNAYQGFAKQNYTMLDNLKLGYGGTKTEMERLISDANRVKEANGEMADLSIDSFADITEAIHIIQTEMGITGTTALEADKTISGSINSMKSAWQNLLTGFANGNADLGQLVTNLIDSVLTVGDNVLPAVDQIVNSIMEALPKILNGIIDNLPKFLSAGTNILNSLISGINQNLPAIMNAVMQIITTLTSALIQNLPQILQMGIQIIVSLIQGISQQLPTLIPQIIDAVLLMAETLVDNIDLIIDAGIQLIIGLAEGLIEALPDLIDKIPVIIDKLITAITDNLPKLIETGITLIVKLAEGLIKAIPQLVSKIPQIITSIVKGFTNGMSSIKDIGKNLVKGLWEGINNTVDWIMGKIKGFGKSVINGLKDFFGIHSPSTVLRDNIGVNMAKGIGVGFENEMKDVNKEIQKALPTDFDLDTNVNVNKNIDSNKFSENSNFGLAVEAFKVALKDMKIVLDDEVAGSFVENTMERVIYS